MRIDRTKLQLAMARACISTKALSAASQMPEATVINAVSGHRIRPYTLGRIAKALNIDVLEILDDTDFPRKEVKNGHKLIQGEKA